MIVDDHTLDDEMLTFYKNAVDAMPDGLLITSARKMPELLNGLKQDKPNVEQLRQRVTAKLQLKTPPPPVLDILRSATLSESLIDVLSEKTIKLGLASLLDHFGRLSILAAMLLDARESVRELALAEMAKPPKARVATKTKEAELFKNRFKPLLETLRPILEGVPYEAPAPRTVTLAPAPIVTKEQQERDIVSSTLYRQLQKERNLLVTDRDKLQGQVNKLSADLAGQTRLASERSSDLVAMQSQLNQRVAQGIADGLKNRLAPWLESCESLANWSSKSSSRLNSAQQLLAQQAQQDKRYGIRTQVAEELAQARHLLAALKNAQQESLRPLPQLFDEIRALAAHIEATEARLNQTSLQPQTPQLRELAQTLQTLHDMDALQAHKKAMERTMLTEGWSMGLCQQAYALINRQIMAIYAMHHPDPKDLAPPITASQLLEDCLLNARPCRLLIDGHNLLPKLKPIIGGDYFREGQGPNAKARALLIDCIKSLTASHPLLQADIWFDGPDDQHWSETDNLRVWFSGGKGSDRADGRILESLQSEVYRGSHTTLLLVTEDRELLLQAQQKGAVGVSPLEMWTMVC
jgi:hypothetical protein